MPQSAFLNGNIPDNRGYVSNLLKSSQQGTEAAAGRNGDQLSGGICPTCQTKRVDPLDSR